MNPNNAHPGSSEQGSSGGGPIIPAQSIEARLALRNSGLEPPKPAGADSFDLKAILKAFQRRWPLAIGVGVLCSLTAVAAAWFLLPSAKYTAHATLKIDPFRPKIVFDTREPQPDARTYQQTQVHLLKSRMVLEEALRKPAIANLPTIRANADDPVEWLEKNLSIQTLPSSMILQVSLSGNNPEDLARVVNAVTDAYMSLVVDVDRKSRIARLEELRRLWNQYKDELETKRKQLREMVQNTGTSSPNVLELQQEFLLDSIQAARSELLRIQPEKKKLEIALMMLEARAAQTQNQARATTPLGPTLAAPAQPFSLSETQISRVIENDSVVQDLRAQIAKHQEHINYVKSVARKGSNDAAASKARREINSLHVQLANRLAALKQELIERGITTQNDPEVAGADLAGTTPRPTVADSIEGARIQLQTLKYYELALQEDIKKLREQANAVGVQTIDVQNELDEVRIVEDTARQMGTEIQNVEVELQAPPRVSIIDEARTPRTVDNGKKIKMTGMAGLGAFGLAVFGITFLEYRARRISSTDEVVQNLGLRLVGALPPMPSANQRMLRLSRPSEEQWRSRLVESVDATRTMLLHASRTESIRVVMIASALKGEGKTSLSGHLATSLARAGRKTLLIDCDLRKPDIHKVFDLPPEPGLCEVYRGENDVHEVIQPTPAADLSIITAGRCDPLALQVLAQDGARNLFDSLLSEYDFLIVDSAPILPVADSLLLSQQVDGVLFSILRDVSCLPHVQSAYERVAGLGSRILGAVVNGAPSQSYAYNNYNSVYGE